MNDPNSLEKASIEQTANSRCQCDTTWQRVQQMEGVALTAAPHPIVTVLCVSETLVLT